MLNSSVRSRLSKFNNWLDTFGRNLEENKTLVVKLPAEGVVGYKEAMSSRNWEDSVVSVEKLFARFCMHVGYILHISIA